MATETGHPCLFLRLPHEILQEIVAYVAALRPLEAQDLKENREKNYVKLGNFGKTKMLLSYKQPDRPTLNTLQALAAVNKEMNQMCCSVLWQALRFPSTFPVSMSAWDALIEKYGSNVKSIEIRLSTDWFAPPRKTPYSLGPRNSIKKKRNPSQILIPEGDNLLTKYSKPTKPSRYPQYDHDLHQGISRENVFRLLHELPNLNALHIIFTRHFNSYFTAGHATRFDLNLSSLIAHTNRIRDFSITGHREGIHIFISCIINSIKLLPNLESFHCKDIRSNTSAGAEEFASALSELKQLRRISIHFSQVLDSSFQGYYPAAHNVLELSLNACRDLPLSRAPFFISSWTPRLTYLTLLRDTRMLNSELKNFNPEDHQFHLPSLTHLTIRQELECDYLQCFQECKNITHLTYFDITEPELAKFLDSLSAIFSQLKILIIHRKRVIDENLEQEEENFKTSMIPLSNFCQQNGIKFFIS